MFSLFSVLDSGKWHFFYCFAVFSRGSGVQLFTVSPSARFSSKHHKIQIEFSFLPLPPERPDISAGISSGSLKSMDLVKSFCLIDYLVFKAPQALFTLLYINSFSLNIASLSPVKKKRAYLRHSMECADDAASGNIERFQRSRPEPTPHANPGHIHFWLTPQPDPRAWSAAVSVAETCNVYTIRAFFGDPDAALPHWIKVL